MNDTASRERGSIGASVTQQTNDCEDPCRPGLRERVAMDLRRAERETGRTMRLSELDHLFSKHPEIARMLELMEDIRR